MDCFYVQVEQRLNPALKNTPCVVAQYKTWKGGGWVPDAEMHIKWSMMKHCFPAQPRSLKLILHCTHDCTPFTSAKKQRQTLSICRSGSSHFTSEQPLNGYSNQRHAVFTLSYLVILIHQLSGFQIFEESLTFDQTAWLQREARREQTLFELRGPFKLLSLCWKLIRSLLNSLHKDLVKCLDAM